VVVLQACALANPSPRLRHGGLPSGGFHRTTADSAGPSKLTGNPGNPARNGGKAASSLSSRVVVWDRFKSWWAHPRLLNDPIYLGR